MSLAEAHVLQEFLLGDGVHHQHHALPEKLEQVKEAVDPRAPAAIRGNGVPAPAVPGSVPAAPQAPDTQASISREATESALVQMDFTDSISTSGTPLVAGSAVILSLTGWRRKKARLAEQRAMQRLNSDYRVHIDRSQLASDQQCFHAQESQQNTSSRMVFDMESGKLQRLKKAS